MYKASPRSREHGRPQACCCRHTVGVVCHVCCLLELGMLSMHEHTNTNAQQMYLPKMKMKMPNAKCKCMTNEKCPKLILRMYIIDRWMIIIILYRDERGREAVWHRPLQAGGMVSPLPKFLMSVKSSSLFLSTTTPRRPLDEASSLTATSH